MTTENRYAAPTSGLDDAGSGAPNHYGDAGNGLRFANLLIDIHIGLGLPWLVVAQSAVGRDVLQGPLMDSFGFVVMPLYYIGLEALTGRTLGKLVTGTKVVNLHGHAPSALQILGRTLTRFVPFEPFSFFDTGSGPGGWHDRWSNTRVVVVRLRPAKWQKETE